MASSTPPLPDGDRARERGRWTGDTCPSTGFDTLAKAAALTFAIRSWATSSMPARRSILGLAMKSTAPSSSARNVVSQPASVSELTITTGMGCPRISFSRNVSPSILGISTSRVSTSGFKALIFSRAMYGSGADPTTSISGSFERSVANTWRIRAESSTVSTRIFPMRRLSEGANPGQVRFRRFVRACVRQRNVQNSVTSSADCCLTSFIFAAYSDSRSKIV